MKRPPLTDPSARFKGGIRYYHRAGSKNSSWDAWVDGEPNDTLPKKSRKWLKILGIIAAILVLGGIVAGLVIELGRI